MSKFSCGFRAGARIVITYCACIAYVITRYCITQYTTTRPASVGLFLFGQLPESLDTSNQSSLSHHTVKYCTTDLAHRQIPVTRVAYRLIVRVDGVKKLSA